MQKTSRVHYHTLKTDPDAFDEIRAGRQRFQLRKNDRNFQAGDHLILLKTEHPASEMRKGAALAYTGEELRVAITSILHGPREGLEEGMSILSIEPVSEPREAHQ